MTLTLEKSPPAAPRGAEKPATRKRLIPVSIHTLDPSAPLGFSLYMRDSDEQYRLYCDKDVSIEEKHIQRLAEQGVSSLFIDAEEHACYQTYLRDNLESILSDESVALTRRMASLNEVVRDVMGKSFRAGNTDETVSVCKQMAHVSVNVICRDDVVVRDLFNVMYHDYHTFTHSANVAFYCVALAKSLGITDRDSLQEIATGALLHDVGKLKIPNHILTKPGRLTDAEFTVIQDHPVTGFRMLCRRDDLSLGQLMMVYQHHERLNGKGYPVGIGNNEIDLWARLCAVADVFEALTSNRPYRPGLSTRETFEIMERDAGKTLDRDILQCWKATIALS